MNTTETVPVKGANLPSTSQSLMPQENEIICDLMDLIESAGFCNENVEGMDFNCAAEFESLFENLVEEMELGNGQEILLGQGTGLPAASESNRHTGLTTDSDMRLNTGLAAVSDSNLNTGLKTDSDSNPNTGLTADSDMRLNTGLSVESEVSLCDDASMSSGTEVKVAIVGGLNLEINSSTAKNMFPKMNSIADTNQQNLTTHASIEVTVRDSGQAMASGVPIMLEESMSEGKSHTMQTNCAPDSTTETDNTHVEQHTNTTVFDMDILEGLLVTTKPRHSVTTRSYYTGINCPQSPVVSSGVQQNETGNRAHVQKPELCSQSRAQCVRMNINSMLDLDGHQYSSSTCVKNGGCLTNSRRPSGAEVKNGLVAESQNHVAPQTLRIGDSLNTCVVTCRDNTPLPDLSKLEGKVMSATYVNPHVLLKCPPYQQNLNSVQPLFSDSSAAVGQKGAEHHMTAPKAEQNKISGICTSSRTLLSKPNDVKLRNTQQSKLNAKEVTINKIRSYLKSLAAFPGSNKDKFSAFVFEKPSVPERNLRSCSKKKKISKTERLPKGRKTHSEQNDLLLPLKNNPHPDCWNCNCNCNSSSTDSSSRVNNVGKPCQC
jgi:hypothetical protein